MPKFYTNKNLSCPKPTFHPALEINDGKAAPCPRHHSPMTTLRREVQDAKKEGGLTNGVSILKMAQTVCGKQA
jgi:hypothetical protein